MIGSASRFILKAGLLWAAILAASVATSVFIGVAGEAVPEDGPLAAGVAFLVVNGLHALVLAAIAHRAALGGWQLGLVLGGTLFFAQSFLLLIEAVYFAQSVSVPIAELAAGSIIALAAAAAVGLLATFVFNGKGRFNFELGNRVRFAYSLAGVTLLYVLAYFTAGYFIAWAAPEVRAYYADGIQIDVLNLACFQVFRGFMWALLALVIVRSLERGPLVAAVVVGLCFSVLASAQLLYPNAFIPWEVRLPHLVEIGVSNFLFGFAAALILRRPA